MRSKLKVSLFVLDTKSQHGLYFINDTELAQDDRFFPHFLRNIYLTISLVNLVFSDSWPNYFCERILT